MTKAGVGYTVGDNTPHHSNRDYTPDSAERALADQNDYYSLFHHEDGTPFTDDETVDALFAASVAKYNEAQIAKGHSERTIDSYAAKLKEQNAKAQKKLDEFWATHDKNEKGLKPPRGPQKVVEAAVINVGGRDDGYGVCDAEFDAERWHALREADKKNGTSTAGEYVREHLNDADQLERQRAALLMVRDRWNERFPHFKLIRFNLHFDEPAGAPHADVAWVPFGEDYKKGMEEQVSLDKALRLDGFKTGRGVDAMGKFMEAVRGFVTECAEECGIECEAKGLNGRKHQRTDEYKQARRELEALESRKGEVAREVQSLTDEARTLDAKNAEKRSEGARLDAENAKRSKAVEKREKAVSDRETAADAREKKLTRRETVLGQREKIVDALARGNTSKFDKLNAREQTLNGREKELGQREQVVGALARGVHERAKVVEATAKRQEQVAKMFETVKRAVTDFFPAFAFWIRKLRFPASEKVADQLDEVVRVFGETEVGDVPTLDGFQADLEELNDGFCEEYERRLEQERQNQQRRTEPQRVRMVPTDPDPTPNRYDGLSL